MTYLGFPRLHFSGHYQADPSTVNNDPYHFDVAKFRPSFDEPGQGGDERVVEPGRQGCLAVPGLRGPQYPLR